jgi:hypothetical protein
MNLMFVIRNLLIFLQKIIGLNIRITIFILFIATFLNAQEIPCKQYIAENIAEFNDNNSIIMNEAYNRCRFFVLGEHHYRKENSDFFLTVLKNLYQNANVRVVFMEASFAAGLIVEHYLKTGDESNLNYMNNQFSTEHYQKLKLFYDDLPNDDKFHIIGVDVDNYDIASNFAYAVNLLFKDKSMPKKLNILLNEFSILAPPADRRNNKVFEEIYSDFISKPEYYKNILNDNYNVYKNLLNRINGSLYFKYYDYNKGQDSIPQTMRENYIYNNVVNAIKNYPNYNYFAQFGLAHVGLSHFLIIPEENKVESFVAKLNHREKSPIKNQVCSIAILYYNIKIGNVNFSNYKLFYYWIQMHYANLRKSYLPNKIYRNIKNYTEKDKMYMLRLDNENSPFKEIARKNFQYVILSR